MACAQSKEELNKELYDVCCNRGTLDEVKALVAQGARFGYQDPNGLDAFFVPAGLGVRKL